MRFTIDREQFLKGLNVSGKAISPKSPIPVLSNIKLDMTDSGLVVLGSNTELAIETLIPLKIGDKEIIRDYEKGATLIASKFISEIVRRVEGQEITVDVIDDTIVNVSDGRSVFKLNSVKAEEYPDLEMNLNGTEFSLKGDDFKELVEQTAFAASTKDQRPILTVLNLEIANGQVVATATDSARLAKKTVSIQDSTVSVVANVPAQVMVEISRLCENEPEVRISVSDKKITVALNNTLITSRLISGEYPNTKHIIPHGFSYYLEANAQELISAMERVSLLSIERENVIKLTMSEDSVEISSKSSQIGSAVEKLSVFQYTGERLEISFNSMYVMQAIRATKCEDVTLAFLGEMKPFVIKNIKDESHVQLVTPVRTY